MADDNHPIIEPTPFARAEAGTAKRRNYLKPVPVALGIAFLVLATAVAFMFTATAVRFSVEPAPESFDIVSGLPTWQLGERYLMLPGDYTVTAALEGYEPLETTVTVTTDDDQVFDFDLQKLPGILEIRTEPGVGAEVLIDQNLVGVTPLRLEEIAPGLHDVKIVPERYLQVDTEIEIEGMRREQTLTVPLTPAWADVTIESVPAGAAIIIDDEEIGTTPATLEILEGERLL